MSRFFYLLVSYRKMDAEILPDLESITIDLLPLQVGLLLARKPAKRLIRLAGVPRLPDWELS